MDVLEKFKNLDEDLSLIGLEKSDYEVEYFCTPVGAKIIGWECEGIHYCFIEGLGETVFAVNPETAEEHYVRPLAENFEKFMKKSALRLAFRDTIPVLTGYLFLGIGFELSLKDFCFGFLVFSGVTRCLECRLCQFHFRTECGHLRLCGFQGGLKFGGFSLKEYLRFVFSACHGCFPPPSVVRNSAIHRKHSCCLRQILKKPHRCSRTSRPECQR